MEQIPVDCYCTCHPGKVHEVTAEDGQSPKRVAFRGVQRLSALRVKIGCPPSRTSPAAPVWEPRRPPEGAAATGGGLPLSTDGATDLRLPDPSNPRTLGRAGLPERFFNTQGRYRNR